MDDLFSIDGLDESAPAVPDAIAPRPFLPHHLPDGTPLHLTAGILADLAAIYHDEFTAYVPQRADEFATMLWMASRPKDERGGAWRYKRFGKNGNIADSQPPLQSDFHALRYTVSQWIDDTFRASESDYVRQLALRLWQHHNDARVTVTDQKKSSQDPETDRPSTTQTASPNTCTPSQPATSSPETAHYGT